MFVLVSYVFMMTLYVHLHFIYLLTYLSLFYVVHSVHL